MSALVLASASPRRREILTTLGVTFEVRPSGADETPAPGEAPAEYVRRVAAAKAAEIAAGCAPGRWVLAADTIVTLDGELLGKPESPEHAAQMLRKLAGRAHEVMTGVALHRADAGLIASFTVTTRVRFRALSDAAITRYVANGEGVDKAGGYAVQGMAAGFVEGLEGSYSNVVGLPAAETVALLEEYGVIGAWPEVLA